MLDFTFFQQLFTYFDKIPYSLELLQTFLILIGAYILNNWVINRWFIRLGKRAKLKKHYLKPLKNVVSFLVYVVVLALILGVFGLTGSLTSLLAGAGFAGIVVGFAAKDIIGNLIGGVVLILDKPFRIGDVIKIKDVFGKVHNISIRSTTIKTFDGELVTVPNAMAMNEIIVNRTLDNMVYRINFSIGVDYDSNINKVLDVCKDVLSSINEIK
ncbi:MAG: mechanosensitive ion channel family protein, partial [Candidatus Aenigmatarchaeota archaeon]